MTEEIQKRIEAIKVGKVPAGYEKTQFGVFPKEWVKDKTLGDIGVFGKGKGIPGNMLGSGDIPCVGYGDIYMKYNHFHFEDAQSFVDEETAKESTPIQKGTLLFTGTGETAEEIGKCVCYNGNETIYAGGDIITFNSENVSPLFLAYQQYQDFSLKRKARLGQGHSVVHIQKSNLENLPAAYPGDENEQKKITEILLKWDKAIALQESLIKNLELQAQALMQKLFLFDCQRSFLFPLVCTPYLYTSKVKTNEYLNAGNIPIVDQGKNTIAGFTNNQKYLNIVEQNGLLIFGDHTTETKFVSFDFAVGGDGVKIFKENPPYNLKYVYYYLKYCPVLIEGYKRHYSILRKKEIVFPCKNGEIDFEKTEHITTTLSRIDKMIELQKLKLNGIIQQQKIMQWLLLTGIVRVKM